MSFMKEFDYLKLQMKDVLYATNNFDPTRVIGGGGFGRVYRGELSSPKGLISVAFKKLDRRFGQGNVEFWKEVMMLSKYKHENLISLMHFCVEGNEMILVYEYASRGSLDRYLSDTSTLSWIQRLKICVGAARGLCFLHDPKETQQRVLHRDVKSSNILLDKNWTAKVSDFGLSKIGPANQAHTYLVSHGVGTPGYCDPLYMEFGFLSKESDVYSFGVVLFEVLCGRLCYEYQNHELVRILVPKWRRCYDEKRLDEIILPGLKEQMDPGSLKSFSDIAYRCVKKAREERPTMAEIVKELELSLKQQEIKLMQHKNRERTYFERLTERVYVDDCSDSEDDYIEDDLVIKHTRNAEPRITLSRDGFHLPKAPRQRFKWPYHFQDPLKSQGQEDDPVIKHLRNAEPRNTLSPHRFHVPEALQQKFKWPPLDSFIMYQQKLQKLKTSSTDDPVIKDLRNAEPRNTLSPHGFHVPEAPQYKFKVEKLQDAKYSLLDPSNYENIDVIYLFASMSVVLWL